MQLTSSSAGADHNTIMRSDIQFLNVCAVVLNVFWDILLTLESIQPYHVTLRNPATAVKTLCLKLRERFKTL